MQHPFAEFRSKKHPSAGVVAPAMDALLVDIQYNAPALHCQGKMNDSISILAIFTSLFSILRKIYDFMHLLVR